MQAGKCKEALARESRLGSINTLANTMKHCINVSNYRLDGRVGAGGWEEQKKTDEADEESQTANLEQHNPVFLNSH